MLLCTPSAYGEGTGPSVTATYTIDSLAVDLGLSVYWSDINIGAKSEMYELMEELAAQGKSP